MTINEIFTDSILNQFDAHLRLNLFYKNLDFQNHFLEETKNVIKNHRNDLLLMDKENQSDRWVDLMTGKAIETFGKGNQFINTQKDNIAELKNLYKILWEEIVEELKSDHLNFDVIQESHLKRLSAWLIKTNSFVKDINDPLSPKIIEIACSEYSADFQIQLLNIDLQNIRQPVLDIGCGQNANLVNYLRQSGIDAYGMDRLLDGSDNFIKADWLDYDFKPHYWGTIISNLSFALHFTSHHHRKDGEYILYARKYMEILNSLKLHGSFYYAPGLPFIEAHLPKDKFKTITHRINEDFSCTRVTCI